MQRKITPPLERFLQFIEISESGCWNWQAAKDKDGYGLFKLRRTKQIRAHRFAYEIFRMPIQANMQIDHLCRNHDCVNPDHLEAVTSRENSLRGRSPRMILHHLNHCANGHPFNTENTEFFPNGTVKRCRICARKYEQANRHRWHRKRTHNQGPR